ncbi:37S ribosomal protein S24 mitochondrial [Bienertia sinuspersici]
MRRALLRNASLYTRNLLSSSSISSKPKLFPQNVLPPISDSYSLKFFSSENDSSDQNSKPLSSESNLTQPQIKDPTIDVEDVSNNELKTRVEKYLAGDEEALESVLEAILSRRITGKHDDTDDEIMEDIRFAPIDQMSDEDFGEDFESDFEDGHETDDEVPNLYNAKELVVKRMVDDEYFNMDDKKWNDIVQEATEKGYARDMRECEEILEDMRDWDKLLPDDIKQKVKAKFDELGDKCERQELEPEEAYQQFKEFEDQIVAEYMDKMEKEEPPKVDEIAKAVEKKRSDDPPGVGPILRWHTRVVFAPGGDAWHPKNRKIKLSVTVKELGLTKYQFRRLRELVGKRYNPGKDELTITSERFEHREENRKDCLRTLLKIVEEAGKANALVEEARTSYVKQRLKANSAFMVRLLAKTKQAPVAIPA